MNERRSGPPRREDGFPHYRDEPYGGRYGDFRDHRDGCRRKAPFPPQRERSPFRKDIPPSPHSRSGSSLSSRSYSPERSKGYSYQSQQRKRYEESYSQGRESEKDRPSSYSVSASRDGSPQSSSSASKVSAEKSNRASDPHPAEVPSEKADKPMETTDSSEAQEEFREPCRTSPPPEEVCQLEGEQEASLTAEDEAARIKSDFQERRSQAIATKAREIEKVYRQDCETFGMVVKMLVAKDPSLEKQLQNPLKENLCEIRERCLEDLKHFISELDEVVLHSEGLD